MLFEEVLNPFYVFQIFSMILWFVDNYYYYAVCVVIICVISIAVSLVETKKQLELLREMAVGNGGLVVSVRGSDGGIQMQYYCVPDK